MPGKSELSIMGLHWCSRAEKRLLSGDDMDEIIISRNSKTLRWKGSVPMRNSLAGASISLAWNELVHLASLATRQAAHCPGRMPEFLRQS